MSKHSKYEEFNDNIFAESLIEIEKAPSILGYLNDIEVQKVTSSGHHKSYEKGDYIFRQGDSHNGIHLIDSGRIRSYYVSATGKEVTLAYWTKEHFVGAPQMFGGGTHLWTSIAVESCSTIWLPGKVLKDLIPEMPSLAFGIIDGLAHKSACYAQLLQIIATNSMTGRLAHLLLALTYRPRNNDEEELLLSRNFTHEELANMVGSTRQWVSSTLEKFQEEGLIIRKEHNLVITNSLGLEKKTI